MLELCTQSVEFLWLYIWIRIYNKLVDTRITTSLFSVHIRSLSDSTNRTRTIHVVILVKLYFCLMTYCDVKCYIVLLINVISMCKCFIAHYLGDNCIVFENFTASIGDLMVANWVYWGRVSRASKRIFATIKFPMCREIFKYNTVISILM